jgi:hypothetical protein
VKFVEREPMTKAPTRLGHAEVPPVFCSHLHLRFPSVRGTMQECVLNPHGAYTAALFTTETPPKFDTSYALNTCFLTTIEVGAKALLISEGAAKVLYRGCGYEITAESRALAAEIQQFFRSCRWDAGADV